MSDYHEIMQLLIRDARNLSPLEVGGVFFGLVSVLYERRGNVLLFPTGIISVLIYVYLCFHTKLYADMATNIYYFVVSIYGWYYWASRDKSGKQPPVSRLTQKEVYAYLVILVLSFIVLYLLLKYFTDSNVPVADATTTAISFVGMILLSRKKIENWYAWMAANFISIPLYFYKGLVLTSFQFLIFFIISISGFLVWRKLLEQQTA